MYNFKHMVGIKVECLEPYIEFVEAAMAIAFSSMKSAQSTGAGGRIDTRCLWKVVIAEDDDFGMERHGMMKYESLLAKCYAHMPYFYDLKSRGVLDYVIKAIPEKDWPKWVTPAKETDGKQNVEMDK